MAITEALTQDQAGLPVIELTVPIFLPPKPTASKLLPPPNTGSADPVTTTTGGTLLDDKNYFYGFVSIDAPGNRSEMGFPVPILTGNSGGDTNKNTITDVDFPDEATQYEVYRSDGDSSFFKRIQTAAAIPDPFTFTDTGLSQENVIAPDDSFFVARLYWRKQGERGWRFGAEDDTSPLKFIVPLNISGQVIDLKLAGVGLDGSETSDAVNPTTTHTITGGDATRLQRLNSAGDALDSMQLASRSVTLQAIMQRLTDLGKLGNADDINADGATFGRINIGALTTGDVDLSKAGVINRILSNIADDGTFRKTALAYVDASNRIVALRRATVDVPAADVFRFQGSGAENLDSVVDGAAFRKLALAYADSSGRPNKLRRTASDITAEQTVIENESITRLGERTAANIAETGARKWLPTLNRIWQSQTMRDAAVDSDGNLLLKNIQNNSGTTSGPTTTSSTFATLAEMTKTFTSKGNKLLLIFDATFGVIPTANAFLQLRFVRDGTVIGAIIEVTMVGVTPNNIYPVTLVRVDTGASAASHTWKVEWRRSSGAGTIFSTSTFREIQVVELG